MGRTGVERLLVSCSTSRPITQPHGSGRGCRASRVRSRSGCPTRCQLSGRIEDHYRQRIDELPERTQRLLLIAALAPLGEPRRVGRAGKLLGVGAGAEQPAVLAGLLEANLQFHHPLVRSAVYRATTAEQRRCVHLALAEVG